MIWIFLGLLGLISAYREIQILIETDRWNIIKTWISIWGLNWWDRWYKGFDSFHLPNGLFALVMCIMIIIHPPDYMFGLGCFLPDWLEQPLFILIYWWFYFWVRNIGMHILFLRGKYREWKYLSPIVF